jgi:hypothetical protein
MSLKNSLGYDFIVGTDLDLQEFHCEMLADIFENIGIKLSQKPRIQGEKRLICQLDKSQKEVREISHKIILNIGNILGIAGIIIQNRD